MAAFVFGTAHANDTLAKKFISTAIWLGLHQSTPGSSGDPASEFAGGGYIRQRLLFGAPNAKGILNSNNFIFTDMPAGTVAYLGFWDAQFAGQLVGYMPAGGGFPVDDNNQVIGAIGDIGIQLP